MLELYARDHRNTKTKREASDMSLVTETAPSAVSAREASAAKPIWDWRLPVYSTTALSVFYILVRIYEQYFGWYAGLDSFDPKFNTYWMSILWTELPLEGIAFLGIVGYLWKTRDRDLENVAPREELRRFFNLMSLILLYGVAIYWGASYFTEQDGTWHQTVIRDNDFTPSHIIEFYMSYPIYIIIGVTGFMYARTRLPTFGSKGYSIAYLLLFIGPFMIFPNVALNEWGHTFWFMEELFVAPLHWMFVFFGWFALAVFGVSLQILGRVGELYKGYEDLCGLEVTK
jgi:methane/ammonia monooxygenase subunit C